LKKILGGLVALWMLSACSPPHPHNHYSQMYTDDKGDYYAKTYFHGEYMWWLYGVTANQPTWTPIVGTPSSSAPLSAVRSVAVLQNGKPSEVVDEKDVQQEDIENEETEPSEATESNQESPSENTSPSESTGETSSDGGSSGGDAGGGGDGGGGD